MGVVAIVSRQPRLDSFLDLRGTGKIASLEEASAQDAQEQFHLIEPRAVDWRKVKHMLVTGVTQERSTLLAGLQCPGGEGNSTSLGNPPADLQAPMRVEIIHDPVEAIHEWELCGDVLQVPDPIDAGACRTQIPNDVTGGDTEGGQQGTGTVADVLELTLLDGAGPGQPRGILPLEDLDPGLLVAGQDQAALLVEARGIETTFELKAGVFRSV
jgi:hypothetical protein